ncbi:MAG: quinone-dependent dihydroorotate dehydrogenase [Minisyncoccia bacterium]|jgi:dihydroorotate dehydrogenase
MYKLVRPFLFLPDAEVAHERTHALGRVLKYSPFREIVRSLYAFEDERLRVHAFGLSFKNPVGLAAGFDKNAEITPVLSALGFGFVEVGTITPRPQPGNPKPRLFRLPKDEAIINRMGFNGNGAEAAKNNLMAHAGRRDCVLGVNIGKNKTTPNENAVDDYETCFRTLSPLADYVAVNVSSPNTPGLRALQEKDALTKLLKALQRLNRDAKNQKPILLKIAPDLTEGQLNDVVDIVRETGTSGIIATNTTIARVDLGTSGAKVAAMGAGGLSGRPLRERSNEIIRYLYKRSRGTIPLVGAGGIFSAEDAYEKIRAGASLVEIYTGLVYEGPGLVKKIKKGLVKLLERDGFSSIEEAVGTKNT